jgi:hypothetical protein
MKVILAPVGSAGDINPFVVLGAELRRRGHRVTIIAPAVFEAPSSNAGLDFVTLGTAEDYERATQNPDLWHPRRGIQIVLDMISGQWRPGYAAIERLYEPDETMLVGSTLALFVRVFEELHDVPAATVHLSPGLFRSDFQQQALPSGMDISWWPRWAKRTLWWAVDRFAADPLVAPQLNRWRAELGLPPVSRVFNAWLHSPQRVLACFPDWFGEPQPDWPAQVRVTGFLLSDESCAPDARGTPRPPADAREDPAGAAELEQFLSSGAPPIAFTPGSANRHAAPSRAPRGLRAVQDAVSKDGGGGPSRRHRHVRPGAGCRCSAASHADGVRSARQRGAHRETARGQVALTGALQGAGRSGRSPVAAVEQRGCGRVPPMAGADESRQRGRAGVRSRREAVRSAVRSSRAGRGRIVRGQPTMTAPVLW